MCDRKTLTLNELSLLWAIKWHVEHARFACNIIVGALDRRDSTTTCPSLVTATVHDKSKSLTHQSTSSHSVLIVWKSSVCWFVLLDRTMFPIASVTRIMMYLLQNFQIRFDFLLKRWPQNKYLNFQPCRQQNDPRLRRKSRESHSVKVPATEGLGPHYKTRGRKDTEDLVKNGFSYGDTKVLKWRKKIPCSGDDGLRMMKLVTYLYVDFRQGSGLKFQRIKG